MSQSGAMRAAVPVGIAAAVVQVVGLSRWPLLVPGYARDATSSGPAVAGTARGHFETAHHVLGTAIGETLGYALTAAWTILVLIALGQTLGGRWFTILGGLSAVLIAVGVVSPLHVPGVDLANFVGYVLRSGWLVALAAMLLRRRAERPVLAGASR